MSLLIKDFGNDTLCYSLSDLTKALQEKYLGKSVTIEISREDGIKKIYFVDIKSNGSIIDSYKNTPIQPELFVTGG